MSPPRILLLSLLVCPTLPAQVCEVDYGQIPAWEIERESAAEEHEQFVDQHGTLLFEVFKSGGDDREEPVPRSQLPERLRTVVDCLLDGRAPSRIQREEEWGLSVLAVKWRTAAGVQEIKALEDGTLLYLELADRTPLPPAVAARMTEGSEVEALVLFLSPPVLDRMRAAARYAPATEIAPPLGAAIERLVSSPFSVEGRSLREFLDWVARKGGWELRFADQALAARASEVVLHGSIDGLSLEEALSTLVAVSGLGYRLEDGLLLVESATAPAGGRTGASKTASRAERMPLFGS